MSCKSIDNPRLMCHATTVPSEEEPLQTVLSLKDHVTPAGHEPLFTLLDRLSRVRPLEDDESRLLGFVVGSQKRRERSGEVRFKWTYALDAELAQSVKKTGGYVAFAQKHNITPNAARCRYLRKVKGNG